MMPATALPTSRPKYDISRIKDAARGVWDCVFQDLAGIDRGVLDGLHHPCPKCGGTDRFRMLDADAGALHCNQCFSVDNGDGIAALMWYCGWTFPETLQRLAEFFHQLDMESVGYEAVRTGCVIANTAATATALAARELSQSAAQPDQPVKGGDEPAPAKETKDPARSLTFRPWSKIQSALWCETKPGVTVAALELIGATLAKHLDQFTVIALPAHGTTGLTAPPVGWVLFNQTGDTLPIYHGPGKPKTYERVKVTSGSEAGLVNAHALAVLNDPERRKKVRVIWKTEGVSDCLVLQSLISLAAVANPELLETHLVITNSDGAKGKPKSWMLDLIASCESLEAFYVVHDCDKPGQAGAIGWTDHKRKFHPGWCQRVADALAAAKRTTVTVRNVLLPYPITEDHGKDLRDWANEPTDTGSKREYGHLLPLAESSDAITAKPASKSVAGYVTADDGDSGDSGDATTTKDAWTDGIPDGVVCNGIPNGEDVITPLAMSAILKRVDRVAAGWPRRIQSRLFVHAEHTDAPIHWLEKPESLMGYLGSVGQFGPPRFYGQAGFHTKAEVFSELQRLGVNYRAIETIPHEPPIKDHYYACEPIEPSPAPSAESNSFKPDEFQGGTTSAFDAPQKTSALEQLLDRFSPSSDIDRDLILAMFATAVWGGSGGSRPLFVITSRDGRGVGKSTLAEMLGQIVGGIMAFSPGEDLEEVKKRLLSPEGATKRVALIDNLKTHRFSWAEFESLVTARDISGRQMYVGEGSRPNTLTWIATVNGLSASTDIAQRSVIIFMDRPKHSGDWSAETREFIDKHHKEILSDLIAFLRREQFFPTKNTRWGEWERCVLSRLPEPSEAQRVMLERQKAADVEDEEAGIISDFIWSKLLKLNDNFDNRENYELDSRVFVPSAIIAEWYCEATKERHSVTTVSRMLKQRIEEGGMPQLIIAPHKKGARGFIWCHSGHLGQYSSQINRNVDTEYPIRKDLEKRICGIAWKRSDDEE